MLNITNEQRKKIKKCVPKIDDYINTDNLGDLLIEIDDAIIEFGMDSNQDELTQIGIELQKIYDDIYHQN